MVSASEGPLPMIIRVSVAEATLLRVHRRDSRANFAADFIDRPRRLMKPAAELEMLMDLELV